MMKLISVILVVMCPTAFASTVMSEFECNSGPGATMTHYSYLKEPKLEKSGYTLGYKTGSFSYLENGTIYFYDKINYYDGQYDSDHAEIDSNRNTTVLHNQIVNFSGKKGISEFYAKGFYPNNRALSAWKKIRYDDLSWDYKERLPAKPVKILYLGSKSRSHKIEPTDYSSPEKRYYNLYRDNTSYLSNEIFVMANATMGPVAGAKGEYDFKYKADVKNGVVEIKDATAWTNESISKRIDWERDALMTGNVSVKNTLVSKGLFFPAAGLDSDWLPCCFDGTNPPIVNIGPNCRGECNGSGKCVDCGWPSSSTYGVLTPGKLLPDNTTCCPECTPEKLEECYEQCNKYNGTVNKEHCLGDCDEKCKNFTCINGDCPGFECIYTYAEDSGGRTTITEAKPLIQEYRITIVNMIKSVGTYDIDDIDELDSMFNYSKKVTKGDPVTYKIRVTCGDPVNSITNITVTDILPNGLDYVQGSSKYWFEGKAGTIPTAEEAREKTIAPMPGGNKSKVQAWNVSEIRPGLTLFILFETTVVDNMPTKCLVFDNIAEVKGFVETETQLIERKADPVKAVMIKGGKECNCESCIES